jgi:capsular polysaccharide biosynthesis protein
MPASALQAARARAFARLPQAGSPTRHVLVLPQAPRAFSNQAAVEQIAARAGLDIVDLASLDMAAQIELFRHARLIVAAHGGALANLLFCPPGAAVVELSPACDFRPHFCQLAGKLGLMHAVLPCQTVGNLFHTAMQVPGPRLAVTLDLLLARLALTDAPT